MLKLYFNPMSPNSKRVQVAAVELGVDFDMTNIDLGSGENQAPEFLAKNPNGKVPTVEVDGDFIWESPAILFRLAADFTEVCRLIPSSSAETAEMLKWMFWHASHLEPAINAIAFERLYRPMLTGAPPIEQKIMEQLPVFDRFSEVLDRHFSEKKWIMGEAFTIADIALGTTIEMGRRAEISFEQRPNIGRWLDALVARPSWQ